MSSPHPVAVVIPSWNTLDLLGECLDSVRAQDVPIELLVVDNGSADGTVEYLAREQVRCLALPVNRGFAAAVNLGVAATAAEAVLVLNADAVLEQGCLRDLAAALAGDPRLAGAQPRILQLEPGRPRRADDAKLYSAGQGLLADGRAVELAAGAEQSPRWLEPRAVFGVCGAACLFRREAFERLGGYDERYVSFYEDVDLNVRARIAGWEFAYVPGAVAWHLGNASWQLGFERPAAENARLVARNRLATQAKFMPARALPRITAVELASLAQAARQRRLRATLRGKLEGLRWLPSLWRERRRLGREGDLRAPRLWLGRG